MSTATEISLRDLMRKGADDDAIEEARYWEEPTMNPFTESTADPETIIDLSGLAAVERVKE